jgi:hypothetical protein
VNRCEASRHMVLGLSGLAAGICHSTRGAGRVFSGPHRRGAGRQGQAGLRCVTFGTWQPKGEEVSNLWKILAEHGRAGIHKSAFFASTEHELLVVVHVASRVRLKAGLEGLCRLLFSFQAVLIVGLVVVTVCTVSNRFNDPDLWWQLRVGQIIATTHSIPTTDLFSFTAQGHSWTAHEWLAQLGIYDAYAAGSPRALMISLCVFASLIFVLVYALCWMHTGDALASFLGAMIAWFFATVGLAIRALILGHLFLVVEMLFLELGRTKDRRWLWCLPPLFAVWANCHASYVFGALFPERHGEPDAIQFHDVQLPYEIAFPRGGGRTRAEAGALRSMGQGIS